MNNLNVLSWQNESSLSPYPLAKSIGYDNLLIDANFVQFDAFSPVLKTLTVGSDKYIFEIVFDRVTKLVEVDKADLTGVPFDVTIYDGTRYLGKLVLGPEALAIYDLLGSRTLKTNTKFLQFLVKSIPSNCGVYSIDSFFGDLSFLHDDHIWYEGSGQNITFNAVALEGLTDEPYLKTLNLVPPANNNLNITESEIIKVTGAGIGLVTISVVGTSVSNLVVEQNNSIPTNPNPE